MRYVSRRLVQVRLPCAERRRRHLPERREVVDDVERPAVRGDHQVVVLDDRSCTGTGGRLSRSDCQLRAVVERHPHAALGARVEQSRPRRILADRARELLGRDAVDDLRPRRAVVGRLVEDTATSRPADIGCRRHTPCRAVRWPASMIGHSRQVAHFAGVTFFQVLPPSCSRAPSPSSVPAHIRPGCIGDSCKAKMDGVRILHPRLVLRDRSARATHCLRVVARELGADDLITLARYHAS